MQDINKIFIDEGIELVSELESHLMDLESNGVSKEIVNGIFRVMHSLKGGSSMFGFLNLDKLTHHLETIYNQVRDDNSILNQEIINITFKSVDLIKELLTKNVKTEVAEQSELLVKDILVIINKFDRTKDTTEVNENENSNKNTKNAFNSYYVLFKPKQDILINGTNPLYIIEELVDLADDSYVIVRNKDIPSLIEFNYELCYVWWEVIIYTSESIEDLESVFMFVDDAAEIKIKKIVNENVLLYPGIKSFINKLAEKEDYIDYNKIINNKEEKTTKSKTKPNKRSLVNKIKEVKSGINKTNRKKTEISNIKVSSAKLDELMNMVSELVTTQARLLTFAEKEENVELSAISEDITKITRRLRDNAFTIILIPIESILIKFRRLVRDLSIELDKKIRFVTEGTDTELDKTIIELINEPLLHLIRNSIDHGLETTEERIKKGKTEQGTIKLKAFYSGSDVHIQISDDGAGLNLDSIKSKAIEKGLIPPDADLSEKELINLIWQPGFSTVQKATDLSGRGVGMDVVRKKIHSVRGEIEVNTKKDEGTSFTLKLPLTMSIIDGLRVEVNNEEYIIQLSAIDKIHNIKHNQLLQTHNDIIVLDEEQIPYVYLRENFNMPTADIIDEHVIIVKYDNKKIGIIVDEVVGEYQAVLKPLGKHYKNIEIFSGGTILGNGTIALVLDTNKLVREKINKNVKM